jgi:hypothetical protein
VTVAFLRLPLFFCAVLLLAGCGSRDDDADSGRQVSLEPAESARIQGQVMSFCGSCHGLPQPDSFPRDAWYDEIELAYRLFHESGRRDLNPPPMSDVVRWYRTEAPQALSLRKNVESESPLKFRRQLIALGADNIASTVSMQPGVSHLQWSEAAGQEDSGSLLLCDMSRNGLFRLHSAGDGMQVVQLQDARNPAHVTVTDLDADGDSDYLLSEMGSFLPQDHDRGRLVWLRKPGGAVHTLVDNVGRIVDARVGDFDGDADLDVIVAVFGWRKTGQLLFLEQTGLVAGVPQFESRQLDDRHGAIHVPTADLDNDGDLDFVVLFSQEHETIEAFLNRGDATFERQIIFLAGSPSYGSSGIELVDLDGDSDLDVLYSNGDTLDSTLLKPYHSVQWLENTGSFPFERHLIGWLPGASRAVSTDLDSDGDLDVVASAWIPGQPEPVSPRDDGLYATLVWYEQQANAKYACHVLAEGKGGGYMAIAPVDLNVDGHMDIITGHFSFQNQPEAAWIDVFWGQPLGGQ